MHDPIIRNQFLEKRARGRSLISIAAEVKVPYRTLVEWNRQDREVIATMRALEVEAMQERILATHEHQLASLKTELDRVEKEMANRDPEELTTCSLYRMAALLRNEIRKTRIAPDQLEQALAQK